MSISKVEPSELVEILYLMRVCSIEMNSMGCMFWNFLNHQVPEFIEKGNIYKYKTNESVVGIVALNSQNDEEYEKIHWNYTKGKILPLRVLVHPKWREKGICKELIIFAEQYAKDNKFNSIRLDANSDNKYAIDVLKKGQYKKAGDLVLPFQNITIECFEKEIL